MHRDLAEHPLISVLIPTYNRQEVVGRAINSAREQSYPNLEIVVVDDGSTDGTQELLDQYIEEPSIVIVTHEENFGQMASRNTLKDSAHGKYMLYLDSDDEFFDTHVIQRMHNALIKYSTDYVAAPAVESETEQIGEIRIPYNTVFSDLKFQGADILRLLPASLWSSQDFLVNASGWWEWCTRALRGYTWVLIDTPGLFVHTEQEGRMSQRGRDFPEYAAIAYAPVVDSRPEYFVECVYEWGATNRIPMLVDRYNKLGDNERAQKLAKIGRASNLYPIPEPNDSTSLKAKTIMNEFKRFVVRILRALKLKSPQPPEECERKKAPSEEIDWEAAVTRYHQSHAGKGLSK